MHRALGPGAFDRGRPDLDACVLASLLRPAGDDHVAFRHSSYQEYLAAQYLLDEEGRREAAELPGEAFITEQVRAFLAGSISPIDDDSCVLPPGDYLVGPAERLLMRRVHRAVRFDRYPVTVARYRHFLNALRSDGTSEWDLDEQPVGITHVPDRGRLKERNYYDDERFDDFPAVCVNWWSASAFAAFEGKRLPTALEWEAAARGVDGRLFPWGDDPGAAPINCADHWVSGPVVTFQDWQREFAHEAIHEAGATAVGDRPANRSPFGVRDMAGNVWEWTSTCPGDGDAAAVCGGSYDNPLRAVRTSSKSLYRWDGSSNAVGLRCVQDTDG